MPAATSVSERPAVIRVDLGAIFVSMDLSRSKWLITSLSPGGGEKMSKHVIAGGDLAGLLDLFATLQAKAQARMGHSYRTIVIQEAGLDGFWIHRALEKEGIESHVVDPASITTSRRKKRAKTDRIDGEALVRALLAYKRGEPRVCSMVRPPSPEEEDRRRLVRERKALITERVRHSNRIKGLLFAQGISKYEPLRRDRRARLAALRTGDGRELPVHLKAQISRELDRFELLLEQLEAVEAERDALLAQEQVDAKAPAGLLLKLKGIGPEFAAILWSEGLFRHYDNRRQVAAYAGLARPLAERPDRPRARRLQGRQSSAARRPHPAELAMASAPVAIGPGPLVRGAGRPQWRTAAQVHNRGPGSKAARRALEVRQRWRGH